MKNEKYYIGYSSKPSMFMQDSAIAINLDDVNNLALLAITLNFKATARKYPMSTTTEASVYIAALEDYMKENPNHPMREFFDPKFYKLKNLLYFVITLCLMEKRHREEGITTESMEKYNDFLLNYNKFLEYNKNEFSDLIEQEEVSNHRK